MSGNIPRQFIDDLIARVDIVDVINAYVPLKKMGANYSTRCPFHNEKTPSFVVNPAKQFFHCFGCHASGNVISFLMDFSQLNFVEAIEELATFAGLDVPYEARKGALDEGPTKNKLVQLQQLMRQIAHFYSQQLKTHPQKKIAVNYLQSRGIKGEIARDFMVGYAPETWQILTAHFDTTLLCEAGMLSCKNEHYYERFRQRIMFPIRNKRGHVIGFGGRVLDDTQQPKYLNSPETALFHKSNEVYGLYELLKKNPRPSRILLVEGYMDVIALAQFGIEYAVAALGTHITTTQLQLLFRSTTEIVLCFDGDKAGQEAAWKAMEAVFMVFTDNRQIRILVLPDQQDPDSLIRQEGLDAFTQRIEQAMLLSNYFFDHYEQTLNLSSIEGKAALVKQAKPYLLKLADGVFKDMMMVKLQQLSEFEIIIKQPIDKPPRQPPQSRPARMPLEVFTLAILIQYPEQSQAYFKNTSLTDWHTLEFDESELFTLLVKILNEIQPQTTAQLIEYFRFHPQENRIKTLATLPILVPVDGVAAELNGALHQLFAKAKQNRIEKLLAQENTVGLNDQEKNVLRALLR
jgi:DNA primase